MIDLGFTGSNYTRTNKCTVRSNLILERLDKFYANDAWLHMFVDYSVLHLSRTHSDHCPLILNLHKSTSKSPPIFRLEIMWFSHPDFSFVVFANWSFNSNYPNALQKFTDHAINWNKEIFGKIFYKTKITLARLKGLQTMDVTRKNSFHYNLENSLITDFNQLLKHEEYFWKLKSRIQWLNEIDANTRFFHITTTQRRRHNRILALTDSVRNWTFDPTEIQSLITNHFSVIYTTQLISCTAIQPTPSFNSLPNKNIQTLLRPLTHTEIYN